MHNRPKLVVFDMAGTTVADRGEVPAAFSAALQGCGIALSEAQLAAVRGASKREAIAELVARHAGPQWQGRAESVYEAFVGELQRRFAAGVQPIPGAVETFAFLRRHGVRMALTTGFDRDIAGLLLDALGWRSHAAACVCGDDVVRGRPAPYLIFQAMQTAEVDCVHEVAALGDTVLDLQAGHHAGVALNIGVLSGAHTRSQLAAQPHTHLLGSVAELPALLEAMA